MGVQIRTQSNIIADMMDALQRRLPNITTQSGSVVREAFINAPAAQLDLLYQSVETVQNVQTLSVATGGDLDAIGSNYNKARRPPVEAEGEILLVIEDLSSGEDVVVADGSVVGTASIVYTIVGEQTFRSANRSVYRTIALQNQAALEALGITDVEYAATAPIRALPPGELGNVSVGQINQGIIAGIKSFTNLAPTYGGQDVEEDEDFRERIALALAGNSVGTEDGLRATALDTPGVLEAVVIGPDHVLMERDGTVRDEDGTIITEGTGLAADIYIRGSSQQAAVESYTYTDNSVTSDDYGAISTTNDFVLGQTGITESNRFSFQPATDIVSISGSQSGANFREATEVTDEEGNVLLEGNYLLLKDFQADDYKMVQNTETNEIRIACSLATNSTLYVELEAFEVGLRANSALGRDRLKWVSTVAKIDDEVVTRGVEFNGADTLVFSDIDKINTVVEETLVTRETVVIGTDAGFTVFTRHAPVKEIREIRHSRLGTTYAFELTNDVTGEVRLIGRFPPQYGDVLQITYVWKKHYLQPVEYSLQGDTVDWIESFNELPSQTSSVLLPTSLVVEANNLAVQPNTPTYLATNLSELVARTVYTVAYTGDTATYVTDENSAYVEERAGDGDADSVFAFQVRRPPKDEENGAQVARVLRATNITTGVTYNLLDYALRTNQYDKTARVNTALANNEFGLNVIANTTIVEPGDQIQFSQLAQIETWTTQSDFLNNIHGNQAPVFDYTRLEATEDGELHVRLREQNDSLVPVEVNGSIAIDTTWSGLIDVIDNVTVEMGATLTIAPETVVRFKESSAFADTITTEDTFILDNAVTDSDVFEEYYYMFEHSTLTGSFFVITGDGGQDYIIFFTDVVRRVVQPDTSVVFYRNEVLIPSAFYSALQDEIDGAGDPNLTATFIGGLNTTTGVTSVPQSTLNGDTYYCVLLRDVPVVTGLLSQDFTVFEDGNESNSVTNFNFVNESNTLQLSSDTIEDTYVVRYNIPHTVRLALSINGALVIDASTIEETAPIFTSAATLPKTGDWEGIVFNPSSVSGGSVLRHVRIKFASVGIRVVESDPVIDQVIVRDCLTNHVAITGTTVQKLGISDSFQLTSTIFADQGLARTRLFGVPYGFDGYGADNIEGTADDGYGADSIGGTADDGYGADAVPGITRVDVSGLDGYGADDIERTLDDGYGADAIPGAVDALNLTFEPATPADKTITIGTGTYYISNTQYLILSAITADLGTTEFFDTPSTYNKVVVSLDAAQAVVLTYTAANNNADPNLVPDPVSPSTVVDIARVLVENTGSLGAGNISPIEETNLTDVRFYYKIGRDLVVGTPDDLTGIGEGFGADDGYGSDGIPGYTHLQAPSTSPFYVPSSITPPGYGFRKGASDKVVEFRLDDKLVTYIGEIPIFQKIENANRSVVHLMWERDYTVYIDGAIADFGSLSLKAGRDFAIEYDADGYSLVFYNTFDVLELLPTLTTLTGVVTIDYFAVVDNGDITNSLFLNSGASSIALNKASTRIINSTIENPGVYGLEIQHSHAVAENNLITNYTTAPLVQDAESIVNVRHENMWSLAQETRELLRVTDEDQLSEDIDTEVVTFQVLTSDKFASGQVIQIDDELMLVRTVVPGFVTVTRGYNRTTIAQHLIDMTILIYNTRATFVVTGIPSSRVAIHQTDASGNLKAGVSPVYLRALNANTYTVSFPINRRAAFSYVFTFIDERTNAEVQTRAYTLSSVEFERGANIVYNPHHAITRNDETNYSTDPSYIAPEYDDLSIDSNSLAHKDNAVFATPFDPRVSTNRFLGTEQVAQTVTLARGDSTIVLDHVPVSTVSLSVDILVIDTTDSSKTITVIDGSFNTDTNEILIPVVTVATAGTYSVIYDRAVSLGTALVPNYEIGVVSYIFDAEKIVDFTRLLFDRLPGGEVLFRFRVADKVSELSSATYSDSLTTSPSFLLVDDDFARGRVVELEATLKGNDGSIRNGIYLYPILESFTLEITPARDTQFYNVLATSFRQRTGISSVDIELDESDGQGISAETISAVGSQPILNVFVRKAGASVTDAFLVARSKALTIDAKTVEIFGDITTIKEAPRTGDKLAVDYLLTDLNDAEVVTFIQNGTQLTTERFFNVQQIMVQAERDQLPMALDAETIGIRSTNQPEPDVLYLTSYEFEAPKEEELITINFGYNGLIRETSINVDNNSDIVTDSLVRQAFGVNLNIEANVVIGPETDEGQIRINMRDALIAYINELSIGTLITPSEIATVLRVSGVIDVTLTRLARDEETIVNQIQLSDRESAVVDSDDFVATIYILGSSTVTGTN